VTESQGESGEGVFKKKGVGRRAYYFSFNASPAAVYSLFGSSPSSESCIPISTNHCTIT
jgi:hypothetical protein